MLDQTEHFDGISDDEDRYDKLKNRMKEVKLHLKKLVHHYNEQISSLKAEVAELTTLKKDMADLQSRFSKVESIAVQMNQKNKQLSDELSQLYEIINKNNNEGTQRSLSEAAHANMSVIPAVLSMKEKSAEKKRD